MERKLQSPKKDNTLLFIVLGIIFICAFGFVNTASIVTSDGQHFSIWEKQQALEHEQSIACAVWEYSYSISEWICKIPQSIVTPGVAIPLYQSEEGQEPMIFNFSFGKDDPYATTTAEAATKLLEEYGDQPAKVYCGELMWDTTLEALIAELGKEMVFGIPKSSFCTDGGLIEIRPSQ